MTTQIAITEISNVAKRILLKNGVSENDAEIIVDHLLDGELAGHPSHGFYRIPGIVKAVRKAGETFEITREEETDTSVLINGGKRQGLVVALDAVDILVEKSRLANVVVLGGYNYTGTTGSMGYFTSRLAAAGLIGFMMANSEASIPAWGGLEPIFGTNPISVSIPTQEDPIVVDFATSKWAYGDIALAIKEGRRIPEGIVLDKEGNPSTDPNDADYAMLPFGGHKGYCLALIVEVLAGPFVRAKAGKSAVQGTDGFIMIGVKSGLFVSPEQFKSSVTSLTKEIKNSRRLKDVAEIFVPGERSQRTRNERKNQTHIPIVDQVLADIKALDSETDAGIDRSYY